MDSRGIYVKGAHRHTHKIEIRRLFSQFGDIDEVIDRKIKDNVLHFKVYFRDKHVRNRLVRKPPTLICRNRRLQITRIMKEDSYSRFLDRRERSYHSRFTPERSYHSRFTPERPNFKRKRNDETEQPRHVVDFKSYMIEVRNVNKLKEIIFQQKNRIRNLNNEIMNLRVKPTNIKTFPKRKLERSMSM